MLWVGPRRAVHELRPDGRVGRASPARSTGGMDGARRSRSTTSRSTFQIAVLVRARQPVPRPLQPAADPAARRLVADRAGAPRDVAPELVPVPARTGSSCSSRWCSSRRSCRPSSTRSSDELIRLHRRNETRRTSSGASSARSGRARRAPEDDAWVAEVLAPEELLLFRRLPNHDRRHAMRVARRAEDALGPERRAPVDRGRAAARRRQVRRRASVPGRALATIAASGAGGKRRVDALGEAAGLAPSRRALRASTASSAPSRSAAPAAGRRRRSWAAAHHDPETWAHLDDPVRRRPDPRRRRPVTRRQLVSGRFTSL